MANKKKQSGTKKQRGRPPKVHRQALAPTISQQIPVSTPGDGAESGGFGDKLPTSEVSQIIHPTEALVTPPLVTVPPASETPEMAQVTSVTVPPAGEDGANRIENPVPSRQAARRLDWVGQNEIERFEQDEEMGEPQKESYAKVVQGNRLAVNGMKLDYYAPTTDDEGICLCFSEEDIAEEKQIYC
ncbi:hypothetical protein OROHE_005966 [Orobanche hederae]